jgi:hypothetical protein
MTVKKATTTSDLTANQVEDGVAPTVTRDQMVERIAEHTDPEMVAEVKDRKYTKVTSPAGHSTTVPDELVDALVESGYTKGASSKTDSK